MIVQAVLIGMLVMLAGTMPRNLIFAANLRYYPSLPWAVPVMAAYLWFFWSFLRSRYPEGLRANRVPGRVWAWALLSGSLALVALVLALRLLNRFVHLPEQPIPDLSQVSNVTIASLLLMGAPVAGIVEEAAFRGYMQGPIEQRMGLLIAMLITGTMFALSHLDFTWILWPYYLAVAVIYSTVTHLTNSILPSIVLHTSGNIYSNFDLWLHGRAEWQAAPGTDAPVWMLVVVAAATLWATRRLALAARSQRVGL